MSSAMIEHADGLPKPQRNWAILTIALGLVMAVIDGAIANVALPTIARDLNASPAFSIWIVNGYQLAITISLLPLASLGEIIGYRRVYLAGLLLFTLASLFCALAHTLLLLTIARIVQGFGAAGIMSVNAALVRYTYPRACSGAASASMRWWSRSPPRSDRRSAAGHPGGRQPGPICSPSTSRSASGRWRWAALSAAHPAGRSRLRLAKRGAERDDLRPRHRRHRQRRPWRGARSSGCRSLPSRPSPACLLVLRQTHMASPLLPVDLLRIPIFALSIATSIASFCGQMLAFVAMPFYLQSRFGYSAVRSGF